MLVCLLNLQDIDVIRNLLSINIFKGIFIYQLRVNFGRYALKKIQSNPDFCYVLFTDATHFNQRVFNHHYLVYRDQENSRKTRPRNQQKRCLVNFWIGIFRKMIIGCYFLPTILNDYNFCENTLLGLFISHIKTGILYRHIPKKLIGWSRLISWPPRSPI